MNVKEKLTIRVFKYLKICTHASLIVHFIAPSNREIIKVYSAVGMVIGRAMQHNELLHTLN